MTNKIRQEEIDAAREARHRLIDLAKADLERYRKAHQNVEFAAGVLEFAKSQAEPGAVRMDPNQSSGSGGVGCLEDRIYQIVLKEQALDDAIDKREDIRREIMLRIRKVDDKDLRLILIGKYIELIPLAKIPVYYAEAHLKRKHHDALIQYGSQM